LNLSVETIPQQNKCSTQKILVIASCDHQSFQMIGALPALQNIQTLFTVL